MHEGPDYLQGNELDMQTTHTTYTGGDDTRRQARRGLAIFFTIVVALSAPIQALIIASDLDGGRNGLAQYLVLIAALMFVPTTASVVARLALKEGFSDVSFRLGGRRGRNAVLRALVFPIFIGVIAYGVAWAAGLIGFGVPPTGLGGWAAAIAVLVVLNIFLSSGEEIGWRGYMLTRLIDAGVPRPVLASGLIWAAWHVPLFLWGDFVQGVPPLLATAFFMVMAPSLGFVLARMRLETGSVWPAVALHVAWNAAMQAGFQPLATGASSQLWVGESGVITALVLVVAAVVYSRGRWMVLREPPKREEGPGHRANAQAQLRVQ
jgi:membrane protease YdiL (CAAX protease family)